MRLTKVAYTSAKGRVSKTSACVNVGAVLAGYKSRGSLRRHNYR